MTMSRSLYECGNDEARYIGVTDICSHCAEDGKLQPALHFCFDCGVFGRYLCGICLKSHNKSVYNHEVEKIANRSTTRRASNNDGKLKPLLQSNRELQKIIRGHHYLTAVAIAVGMLWLGYEGSMFGPIVFCCLAGLVNVYGIQRAKENDGKLKALQNSNWELQKEITAFEKEIHDCKRALDLANTTLKTKTDVFGRESTNLKSMMKDVVKERDDLLSRDTETDCKLKELQHSNGELQKDSNVLRKDKIGLEKELLDCKVALDLANTTLKTKTDELDHKTTQLKGIMNDITKQRDDLISRAKENDGKLKELQHSLGELQKDKNILQKEKTGLEKELHDRKKALDLANRTLKTRTDALDNESTKLKRRMKDIAQERDDLISRSKENDGKLRELQNSIGELEQDNNILQTANTALKTKIDELGRESASMMKAIIKERDDLLSRQDEGKPDNKLQQQNELRKKERPGIPRSSDVMSDTITISWDPPLIFGDDDYYQISYKDLDHEKKWMFFQGEFRDTTAVLRGLKTSTTFIFRVRIVHEDGEGPYSEESSPICTADSPASRIVRSSTLKEKGTLSPSIFALPLTEIRQARNEKAKTKKIEFGEPPIQNRKSKTIMLVGATGTGKSTLVDGIVNFVLRVDWDDPFRFTVIDLEQEEKNKANEGVNQTKWITCYTINPEKGSRLTYPLNIIDTPGFEDTRGFNRNQDFFGQIRQLFSEREPKCVTFIDAVCFVIKAPDVRLTAVQSHMFQSIMSLFGRDIENNICSLVTFADNIGPLGLAALKGSGLPFGKSFTFNNSGLYARNSNNNSPSLSPIFWNLGLKSFRAFFDHLEQIETKSLQLTKDVLDVRSRLEAVEKILQPQLEAGLSKVNSMKHEIEDIEKNMSLIKDNKDFEYEVDEIRHTMKELPRGQYVFNCANCYITCHENCDRANDDTKATCSAIGSNGNCKICPDRCHWTIHVSIPYVVEYSIVKVKKTYADMQKKYQEASGKLQSQEKVVEKLGEELNDLLDDIEDMMDVIKFCNERLEAIALRPNPLLMTDHIDLMIETEKLEKKEGFLQRIKILKDFRKKAQISKDVEFFSQQARSTLGAAGMKRKRNTKSLNARFD